MSTLFAGWSRRIGQAMRQRQIDRPQLSFNLNWSRRRHFVTARLSDILV